MAHARQTACMLVIGDEILSGKIRDSNSAFAATLLFDRGVDLVRIEVIPDETAVIVERLQHWSSRVTHVITSGGIGPTHDDKTYAAVAEAFGRTLELHEPTLLRMQAHAKARGRDMELNDARRRMAMLPSGAALLPVEGLWVPAAVVENVVVLPGVPQLFEQMLASVASRFVGTRLHRAAVCTQLPEGDIAAVLGAQQNAHPGVAIGSYPRMGEGAYRVKVTVEGADAAEVEQVRASISAAIAGYPPPEDAS